MFKMKEINSDFLTQYQIVDATDADEIRSIMASRISTHAVSIPEWRSITRSTFNSVELGGLSLAWARGFNRMTFRASGRPQLLQFFPLSGSMGVKLNGEHFQASAGVSLAVNAHDGHEKTFSDSYSHLVLSLDDKLIESTLSILIDRPIHNEVRLTSTVGSPQGVRQIGRLVQCLCSAIDDKENTLKLSIVKEYINLITISFIQENLHNYSFQLNVVPVSASTVQERMFLDYIEANWDKPISIETIIQNIGGSASTIFRTFKRRFGVTPMGYVKKKRLENAFRMLSHPAPGTTVLGVAYKCGFLGVGHFSRDFHQMFNILPSAVLKQASRDGDVIDVKIK